MSFTDSFPGFRLRMTRWGVGYLVACLVLGLAAVNTGNNALMAILGLALGSYVISGLWSRQVLGSIGVRVRLPKEVFAGRPAVVEVDLVWILGDICNALMALPNLLGIISLTPVVVMLTYNYFVEGGDNWTSFKG